MEYDAVGLQFFVRLMVGHIGYERIGLCVLVYIRRSEKHYASHGMVLEERLVMFLWQ